VTGDNQTKLLEQRQQLIEMSYELDEKDDLMEHLQQQISGCDEMLADVQD